MKTDTLRSQSVLFVSYPHFIIRLIETTAFLSIYFGSNSSKTDSSGASSSSSSSSPSSSSSIANPSRSSLASSSSASASTLTKRRKIRFFSEEDARLTRDLDSESPVNIFEQTQSTLRYESFYDTIIARQEHYREHINVQDQQRVHEPPSPPTSSSSSSSSSDTNTPDLEPPSPTTPLLLLENPFDIGNSLGYTPTPLNKQKEQNQSPSSSSLPPPPKPNNSNNKSFLAYYLFGYWKGEVVGQRWEREFRKVLEFLSRELAPLMLLALTVETLALIGFTIFFLLETSTFTNSSSGFLTVCILYTIFFCFVLSHVFIATVFYLCTGRKGYDFSSLDNFYKVTGLHLKLLIYALCGMVVMWIQYGLGAGFDPLERYSEFYINHHGGSHGRILSLAANHRPIYELFTFIYLVIQCMMLIAIFKNHRGYVEQNGQTFQVLETMYQDRIKNSNGSESHTAEVLSLAYHPHVQ